MKHSRRIAFVFLIVSIVAMLGIGFYLSATHQGAHPIGGVSPGSIPATKY